MVVSLFVSGEHLPVVQDVLPLTPPASCLLGVQAPYLVLLKNAPTEKKVRGVTGMFMMQMTKCEQKIVN